MQIAFSKHSFSARLLDVKYARLADLENAPEKRIGESGKPYTPPVMQLIFEDNNTIDLVIEDIDRIDVLIEGCCIFIGDEAIALIL